MLRRVRLFKDGAGLVLRIMGIDLEELERIPPSPGDRLLHARIRELGISESTEELLKGYEVVVPPKVSQAQVAADVVLLRRHTLLVDTDEVRNVGDQHTTPCPE